MSNLTVNIALATVKRYQDSTPEQDLAFAQALAFLQATDPKTYSVRGLVAIGAELGRPIGRNRISLLIRVVKAQPENVTAEDFRAAVKVATDENRNGKAPAVPQGDTDTDTETAALTAAAATVTAAPITLDSLRDRLADLMADARTLARGDLLDFLDTVDTEVQYSAESVATRAVA